MHFELILQFFFNYLDVFHDSSLWNTSAAFCSLRSNSSARNTKTSYCYLSFVHRYTTKKLEILVKQKVMLSGIHFLLSGENCGLFVHFTIHVYDVLLFNI